MSASTPMTPALLTAAALEIALVLGGLLGLWRYALSPKGRAEAAPRLPEWTLPPIDFACYLAFPFLGATVLGWIASLAARPYHFDDDTLLVVGGAVMHLGILLGFAGYYWVYRVLARSPARHNLPRNPVVSGIITFAVALPLVVAVDIAWGFVLRRLGLPDKQQDLMDILENTRYEAVRWLLIAVATLLVPFSEELIFRAGLFRYFRTRMPRWTAILLTSMLFAALHQSWAGLAPLFVLAVVLCLAYERTGTIGTTIVAHALFNLNMVLLAMAGISG